VNNSAADRPTQPRVLLAGDAAARPEGLEAALTQAGFSLLEHKETGSSPAADAILITLREMANGALTPLMGALAAESRVPHLVVLSSRDPAGPVAALALGATDALAAPVHLPELCARLEVRIRERCARKGQTGPAAAQSKDADGLETGNLGARLKEEFERARRYSLSFSLVLLGIDELGSLEPERARNLRAEVAQALRRELRAPDLVLPFSEHEFAIVLPETGEAGARQSVGRLRERLTRLPFEGDPRLEPTRFSAGIVTYPHPAAQQCDDLFAMAEAALLRGKGQAGERIGVAI
jgi:diguanylate cyclase (GGDEF)-like protein